MATPRKHLTPAIWHNIFKCMYPECHKYPEIIYGKVHSTIGFIVFCKYHYDVMKQFKDSCGNYWQVVANIGGDT